MKASNDNKNELELLKKVFYEEDYKKFLDIIKGKGEDISSIDISAINNYPNHIIGNNRKDSFISLYKHLKYYLEYNGYYSSKMQEGIALCTAKMAIINEDYPARLHEYMKRGDRYLRGNLCNPFEEISRVLFYAVKKDRWTKSLSDDEVAVNNFAVDEIEIAFCLESACKALNYQSLYIPMSKYYRHGVIEEIGIDLEESDITSAYPISATTKEAREVIVKQLDVLADVHASKIETKYLFGLIPTMNLKDRILTQFRNCLFFAERNIGVYEHTKQLKK